MHARTRSDKNSSMNTCLIMLGSMAANGYAPLVRIRVSVSKIARPIIAAMAAHEAT